MKLHKYIVRFDLPLNLVSVENNAEGIFDCHYNDITKAYKAYAEIKSKGSMVDLIEIVNGIEYSLM